MWILKFLHFFWFLTRWHLKLKFVYSTFWTHFLKNSHSGYLHKYCMTRWYVVQGLFKIGALKYYFHSKCKLTFWIFPRFLKSFFERDSPFIHIRVPPLDFQLRCNSWTLCFSPLPLLSYVLSCLKFRANRGHRGHESHRGHRGHRCHFLV